mgnify:FL=1|tara:strand:- start:5611 stop:5880 length:270 start_codon:yes stop_codon:yes gene_type:complete
MDFKPNGSWVVLPDPTITKTDSGIYLDDSTIEENSKKSNILDVLAVGPQCVFVKVGDTVMVDPRTEAVKAVIDEKNYLIVGEHQLLGKW